MEQQRIANHTMASDLVGMLAYLMPLSRVASETQATVVFPGLGEIGRELDAISTWNKRDNFAEFLLIAGQNPNEKNTFVRSVENLQKPPFSLTRSRNVHSQGDAENTPGQAAWVAERVKELKIMSISLSVSPYHMLRAYLTLLKTFMKAGLKVVIIPLPTPLPPTNIVPEVGVKQTDMVSAELERIVKYQEKGDVATRDEFYEYLGWVWEQPMAKALMA